MPVYYCYPAYLNYMQSTSCKMPGWMAHKLESGLLGEISTTSDMQIIITLLEKSLYMKVKEESEKYGLKLNIKKTKIMASSPITSWQIVGKKMEIVIIFFSGLQNHANVDCSLKIKRRLLLGRNAMTNLDSILRAETALCRQRSIWSNLWFF